MSNTTPNTIITIGRQFGSAGLAIGQKVAQDLGIKLYYKEILDEIIPENAVSKTKKEIPSSFLYSIVMEQHTTGSYIDMPINHKRFIAQVDAIKKIASEESCVLVGLCADYALSGQANVMSFFIHADLPSRIRRIARQYDVTDSKAQDMILEHDTRRSNYYNFYTHKKWGEAESYHACLESSVLGIDGTAAMIEHLVEMKNNNKNVKL